MVYRLIDQSISFHRSLWSFHKFTIVSLQIQEQQNEKTWAKTRPDVKPVSLLSEFLKQKEEARNFKDGKYCASIIDDKEFYKAKKCLEARSKRLKKNKIARQEKQIKRSWSVIKLVCKKYLWRALSI